MANEQTVRQAQNKGPAPLDIPLGGQNIPAAPPASVDEALAEAMRTGKSNPLVAVIERTTKSGVKEKAYFVVRAGRGGKLNEAAAKKGGIKLMKSTCVRASWESPEQIQKLYDGLPTVELKTRFLDSRGGDFRVFTAPAGWSIYLYTILFGSAEKWQGEGIGNPGNVDATNRHWQDSTSETRAFSRTVGRGTGEGLLPGDQLAGSGEVDVPEEYAEAEVLSEAQVAAHLAALTARSMQKSDTDTGWIPKVDHVLPDEEAALDRDDPFRSPDGGGATGDGAGHGDLAGTSAESAEAGGSDPASGGTPDTASRATGPVQDGGTHGAPTQSAGSIDPTKLIALAQQKGVFTLKYATEKFQREVKTLRELSGFELSVVWDDLTAMPDKPPRKEG